MVSSPITGGTKLFLNNLSNIRMQITKKCTLEMTVSAETLMVEAKTIYIKQPIKYFSIRIN
jgi:hypothetical protein